MTHATRSTFVLTLAVIGSLAVAQTRPASAPADAVGVFRAYVAALRAGDVQRATSFVETVPETSRALVDAGVRMAVAIEQVKNEMARQMGPPKLEEEGWNMGQMPDEILRTLRETPGDAQTALLVAADPNPGANGAEFLVAWMVRRDGGWRVPAGVITDGEPGKPYVEPDAAMRAQMTKQFDATARAAGAVLAQLKAKAYKTPVEVQSALVEAMQRAGAM